jgi:hypothetical protein
LTKAGRESYQKPGWVKPKPLPVKKARNVGTFPRSPRPAKPWPTVGVGAAGAAASVYCVFFTDGGCEEVGLGVLRFSQISASPTFSNGPFVNQTIGDSVNALVNDEIKPEDLVIRVISRGEGALIVNTRSSLALLRAGISPSEWVIEDVTGDEFLR